MQSRFLTSRLAQRATMALGAATLPALSFEQGLPQLENPTRGAGNGIMETIRNYGYDIIMLVALQVAASMFRIPPALLTGTHSLWTVVTISIAQLRCSLLTSGSNRQPDRQRDPGRALRPGPGVEPTTHKLRSHHGTQQCFRRNASQAHGPNALLLMRAVVYMIVSGHMRNAYSPLPQSGLLAAANALHSSGGFPHPSIFSNTA